MTRNFSKIAPGMALSALLFSGPGWAQHSVSERIESLEQELAALKQQLQADARCGQLHIDDDAFPVSADPAASITGGGNYGFAVHAYQNESVRVTLDYEAFPLEGEAPGGADRKTEHVILTRVDYKF